MNPCVSRLLARLLPALLSLLPASSWALAGGPDGGGYYFADQAEPNGPTFLWEDISSTGTVASTASGCDDCVQSGVPIGFDFDFYGNVYDTISISSNGFVGFGGQGSSGCCSGRPIPSGGNPNNIIAVWWEDLDPAGGSYQIFYETLGSAPNRRLIIQYDNVPHFPSGTFVWVQVKLYEMTNFIEVHALDAASDGGPHTVGIENDNGSIGTQYHNSGQRLPADTAVRFYRCLFVDNDGDGFDDCSECDDFDPLTYPGAVELCDGKDNDCDGTDPMLEVTDRDGDGLSFCDGDCDDEDETIFIGAPERCDGIDNDCDGAVPQDEVDADSDGYMDCGGDCDDFDPWRFPGYVELCNSIDDDCDGSVDEGLSTDLDGDGHFVAGSCFGPTDDCDDFTRKRYPGNEEVCDLIDNDCDGLIDEANVCGGLTCTAGADDGAAAPVLAGLVLLALALGRRRGFALPR
jgi:hypothetical protein